MSLIITKVEWTNKDGSIVSQTFDNVPEPSSYNWAKQDISDQGAGRTISSDAIKLLRGKARTLELSWNNRSFQEISTALQIFDTEYAWITYYDALTGGYQRKHFYMGDMTANMYNFTVSNGIWSNVKVKCIQAITDK